MSTNLPTERRRARYLEEVAPMTEYDHFQLSRMSDDLVYEFDRMERADGSIGYKRRDQDLWITFEADLGWVGYDKAHGGVTLRPWNVVPADQGDYPPEGEWVSKKGVKSYVYELRYVVAARAVGPLDE